MTIDEFLSTPFDPRKKVFVGIDPGFTGYITVLNADGSLVGWVKTPTIEEVTKKTNRKDKFSRKGKLTAKAGSVSTKTKTTLDEARIIEILKHLGANVVVSIERQFTVTGQGGASGAKTMYGFGFWCGVVQALGMKLQVIEAKDWQNEMLDIPSTVKRNTKEGKEATKAYSVAAVKNWREDLDLRRTNRSRIDDHNLADSVNIARFCWSQNSQP